MNDAKPAFLAFRYSDGTWTVMIVGEEGISEVQEMTAAKLIEIIETLESVNEAQETDWWDIFH
ncbi:hypothetical protein K9B32_20805 [Rhizobium sp. 3T7]|uniref:hypothetical protein n=1 Tax=Rhizobium sp. 3T7 TaxID=2874922 RepID=UPI001CC98436|nr:hypothetical protein [Rhizobium sp. 3T7]MBZ9792528.1 hypothetical protein [Rhizobium sp. 3T7]